MLFSEFQVELGKPDAATPDRTLHIEAGPDDICVVDGLYALPLESTSRLYPRAQSIQVLDEAQVELGEILTCAGEDFTLSKFSAGYVASYLAEISPSQYDQAGSFTYDYLLIRADRLADYKARYMDGSPIWGGFQHAFNQGQTLNITSAEPVRAVSGILLPTEIHIETASRSVLQPFAFERFLKLYHLLELSFDRNLVLKIQALGQDLKGIGLIFSNLDSNELNRLKLITHQCQDATPVVECLRRLTSDNRWSDHIRTIFFEFGKAGNPIVREKEQDFINVITNGTYTLQEIRHVTSIPVAPSPAQQKAFETFSLNLAAYWIYRVRSSIAHSRIGEYLMRVEDEPFVAFFAEPLIRCVLAQVLR